MGWRATQHDGGCWRGSGGVVSAPCAPHHRSSCPMCPPARTQRCAWLLQVARDGACLRSHSCPVCERRGARRLARENITQLDVYADLTLRVFVVAQLAVPCLRLGAETRQAPGGVCGLRWGMLAVVGGAIRVRRDEALVARPRHAVVPRRTQVQLHASRNWFGSLTQYARRFGVHVAHADCEPAAGAAPCSSLCCRPA